MNSEFIGISCAMAQERRVTSRACTAISEKWVCPRSYVFLLLQTGSRAGFQVKIFYA
jgi:hypothetical protein